MMEIKKSLYIWCAKNVYSENGTLSKSTRDQNPLDKNLPDQNQTENRLWVRVKSNSKR